MAVPDSVKSKGAAATLLRHGQTVHSLIRPAQIPEKDRKEGRANLHDYPMEPSAMQVLRSLACKA